MLTLTAEARGASKSGRNGARREGYVPAVLYGKEVAPVPIKVDGSALRDAIKAGARHRLIQLTGPGVASPCMVIMKELQLDNSHQLAHVDFFKPVAGKRFHVRVPVVVRGEEAATMRGIIVERHLSEVDCECFPENVPEAIYADVSMCEAGDHIALGQLTAPDGVRIAGNPEMVILAVRAPMATMIPGEGAAAVVTE